MRFPSHLLEDQITIFFKLYFSDLFQLPKIEEHIFSPHANLCVQLSPPPARRHPRSSYKNGRDILTQSRKLAEPTSLPSQPRLLSLYSESYYFNMKNRTSVLVKINCFSPVLKSPLNH